jgi:hypothetical protein
MSVADKDLSPSDPWSEFEVVELGQPVEAFYGGADGMCPCTNVQCPPVPVGNCGCITECGCITNTCGWYTCC